VLLYVKRWLKAPLRLPDGILQERGKGTPQGSAVSPVLAKVKSEKARGWRPNAVKLTTAPSRPADLGPFSVVPAAGLGWFVER